MPSDLDNSPAIGAFAGPMYVGLAVLMLGAGWVVAGRLGAALAGTYYLIALFGLWLARRAR